MTCTRCHCDMLPCKSPRNPGESIHHGRGLCGSCYYQVTRDGLLEDYPRLTYSADELLDEWVLLRGEGHSVRQAAPRLGVTFQALDRALCRATRRGDPRGLRPGMTQNRLAKEVACGVACGACWESVIRADERASLHTHSAQIGSCVLCDTVLAAPAVGA